MDEPRQRAIYGVTLVAAFGVGILVGRSACSPEPEVVVEERVVEKTPECPPCRPDVADVGPSDTEPVAASPSPPPDKEHRAMPDAPSPPAPQTRRKLLAWVRDRAPNLRTCRPGGGSTVRIAVTLSLNDAGEVQQAGLNAPPEELSAEVLQCLRDKMVAWEPPSDLVEGRNEVVFGLDL